jgi:hypothetical protein
MLNKATIAGLCLAVAAALAGPVMAADASAPAGAGCGPDIAQSANPEVRAKVEANTRKLALGFAQGTVEEQDALLAPNALFWALGIGYLDRSQYVALHRPGKGPTTTKPISAKQTLNHVVVQNDLASVDIEKYVVWPTFTYDQKYNILFQVRGDKICLLKIYSDSSMAKKMLPDIDKSVTKP